MTRVFVVVTLEMSPGYVSSQGILPTRLDPNPLPLGVVGHKPPHTSAFHRKTCAARPSSMSFVRPPPAACRVQQFISSSAGCLFQQMGANSKGKFF